MDLSKHYKLMPQIYSLTFHRSIVQVVLSYGETNTSRIGLSWQLTGSMRRVGKDHLATPAGRQWAVQTLQQKSNAMFCYT